MVLCLSWSYLLFRKSVTIHSRSAHGMIIYVKTTFYDNWRNSRARIGKFSLSISGQTHEFIIYTMPQQAKTDNLTICCRKKRIDISFSWVCPDIDNEFRHNVVKVVCASWIRSYFDNVMTKFMINNRTDTWKTDVTLLNRHLHNRTTCSRWLIAVVLRKSEKKLSLPPSPTSLLAST